MIRQIKCVACIHEPPTTAPLATTLSARRNEENVRVNPPHRGSATDTP